MRRAASERNRGGNGGGVWGVRRGHGRFRFPHSAGRSACAGGRQNQWPKQVVKASGQSQGSKPGVKAESVVKTSGQSQKRGQNQWSKPKE